MRSHGGITKSQHGVACVLRWGSTDGNRNFHNPKSQHCSNAIADHVKAQGIKQIVLLLVVRVRNLASKSGPQRRLCRLARRRLAWRAGGSPGAPEARPGQLCVSKQPGAPEARPGQLCVSKQPAITRFPRPIQIHPQRTGNGVPEGIVHLEPVWPLTRVKQCGFPAQSHSSATVLQVL